MRPGGGGNSLGFVPVFLAGLLVEQYRTARAARISYGGFAPEYALTTCWTAEPVCPPVG
ncbi:hypothetical protein ABT247_10350 [Kitasatospora sp. NPDC001539]|uniref:hypothetical protein n=1 Tax=Kitasatospora sp. NPDC001539 TaxID=3154384 RepID=UPI003326EC8C